MSSNNEKLVKDIQSVVADAEAVLREAAGHGGEGLNELKASMTERLVEVKNRLMVAEEALIEKAKHAARATDEYVHENPWQSAVIAGGVGFLIGYLISSRGD